MTTPEYEPRFLAVVGRMMKDLPSIGTGLFYLALGVWSAFGIASFFPCPWGEWSPYAVWGRWALGYLVLTLIVFWYILAKQSLRDSAACHRIAELERQHTSRHDTP